MFFSESYHKISKPLLGATRMNGLLPIPFHNPAQTCPGNFGPISTDEVIFEKHCIIDLWAC